MGPVPRLHATMFVVILAHLALPLLLRDVRGSEDAATPRGDHRWSYLANADLRPIARSISLSEDRPEDLTEAVDYRGSLQRYAQLRYGSENSRRVVLVVDELDGGEFQLFVDADRDRRITSAEMVVGQGRARTFGLATEIIQEAQPRQDQRQVQVRRGALRDRLSVATLGCVEGHAPWVASDDSAPERLRVRRIDGNANGLFADSRDRLLIDVNGDDQWDRVAEQFAYLPVLKINDRRYAIRSDRMGHKFSLAEITGVGRLRVIAARLPESARVLAFEAMVFSDDGSAYSLKQPNEAIEVPVGRYTLGSVTMTIDDGNSEPWHFVFSRSDTIAEDDWMGVATGQEASLEAVGQPRFVLNTDHGSELHRGATISVKPRVYTQDGLLINLSCRGRQIGSFDRERSHNQCHIKLTSPSSETLSSAQSGFS
jgi:hypothetical protein